MVAECVEEPRFLPLLSSFFVFLLAISLSFCFPFSFFFFPVFFLSSSFFFFFFLPEGPETTDQRTEKELGAKDRMRESDPEQRKA